jgi:ribonuclease VapC
MVVDSSAVVAILRQEPDAERFALALARAPDRWMSAVSLVEAALVIEGRFGERGGRELDALLARSRIEFVAFDDRQAMLARDAFRRFGRGRHPAGLNFGDCLAYALAKHLGEPLLFKGDDFARTDIIPALEGGGAA